MAALLALSVAACGFQPLYGRKSVGEVDTQLAPFSVRQISCRGIAAVHDNDAIFGAPAI